MNYDVLFGFEKDLAEYTGAPYAVATDGATHAIELCMRYHRIKFCRFTPYTYLSIPMLMHRLNIDYEYLVEDQQTWTGEYQFQHTNIWDSARRLERGMYRAGQLQCLSFGNSKPMSLGRIGAVLTDDPEVHRVLSMMRSDGRDCNIGPWPAQHTFNVGYHYCPTLELCYQGRQKLPTIDEAPKFVAYPDCRTIKIIA